MSDGAKLLGVDWHWDDKKWSTIIPAGIRTARWRRGPFTLYRYDIVLPGKKHHYSQWIVKLPFDLSFGVHLPSQLGIAHDEKTCTICNGEAFDPLKRADE